jgi:hypothetical protein
MRTIACRRGCASLSNLEPTTRYRTQANEDVPLPPNCLLAAANQRCQMRALWSRKRLGTIEWGWQWHKSSSASLKSSCRGIVPCPRHGSQGRLAGYRYGDEKVPQLKEQEEKWSLTIEEQRALEIGPPGLFRCDVLYGAGSHERRESCCCCRRRQAQGRSCEEASLDPWHPWPARILVAGMATMMRWFVSLAKSASPQVLKQLLYRHRPAETRFLLPIHHH